MACPYGILPSAGRAMLVVSGPDGRTFASQAGPYSIWHDGAEQYKKPFPHHLQRFSTLRVGRTVATYPALEQHSVLEQTVPKPVPHLPSVETCRFSRSMFDCRSIRARLLFRDCSNASRTRLLAWTTVPVAAAKANVLNPFMAYC